VRLWRVVLPRRADDALSGEGARRYGGRWNHSGQAAVYTSTTLSLAVLEWLANVDPSDGPAELVAVTYELPKDEPVMRLGANDLPAGLRGYPVPKALQRLGAEWIGTGATVALAVPSVVLPFAEEHNIVLNPTHAGITRVTEHRRERVTLDPRLISPDSV